MVLCIGAWLTWPARMRPTFIPGDPDSRRAATARRMATGPEVTTGWRYPVYAAAAAVGGALGRQGTHRPEAAAGYYCRTCDTHLPHGIDHPCEYLRLQRLQREINS
jgi:hypothetical protein